jgi:hypothetical protein
MHLHGLIDYEPESIFFNHEQSARLAGGNLEQSRIDNAFKKKQRSTTTQINYEGDVYWLLSRKQTGNYGVVQVKTPSGACFLYNKRSPPGQKIIIEKEPTV